MQYTLVAVFDNRNDAQKAMDELLAAGFARGDLRLSEGDPAGAASAAAEPDDDSIFGGIRHFFTRVFGTDRSEASQIYAEAVKRGHYVLTLTAEQERDVERAADIVETFGPIDIDETHQQWRAAAMPQDGAGARQQSGAMSQQYAADPSSGQGGVSGNGAAQGSMQRADLGLQTAIPVVQEELKVGKRIVERGGVRIYQHVVSTPVSEDVDLREEHVTVQRRAIDRMVDPADVPAFQEGAFELRESAEEPVIEKTARIVEEVVVGKEVTQRQQQVRDTVRRTEVEIEALSGADEAYFRSHWGSNFAGSGEYDDFLPAYRYGAQMRRSEPFRNLAWDEAETDLRQDWEATRSGSGWEKFKAAVRHGWDRITS
jgi:uncharacterized protein (TIGR02271 family)